MADIYYKTYKVKSSRNGIVLTRNWEGTGIDDFDTRVGLSELRALKLINTFNRQAALCKHVLWTYWLE